jgi:anti-sigma regulatory factor (Ser/Thr protein kinase)
MVEHLRYPKLQTVAYSNPLLGLCHQARNSNDIEIFFDLSKTQFLTPFGIVILAGSISECLNQGKKGRYKRPENSTTRKFLSGIGFNDFFRLSGDNHKIESPKVQLRRLHEVDYELTDQILDVFGSSLSMSEGVKGSLKMALNELMMNAFDHSQSSRGCYVCAQSYQQARKIRLCIADFGIGILKALSKAPQYANLGNDSESIKLAVKEGVTSSPRPTAGYGLSHINRFIDVNQGRMYILSGKGKVAWNFSGIKKRRDEDQTMRFPFQGTIINLEINADREGFYFLESIDGQVF